MNKQILFIVLSFLFSSNAFPQESWIRIYNSDGWQIQSFYEIHNSDNSNTILVQHNTVNGIQDPENGAVKEYSRTDNSWSDPANGMLNTRCVTCVDPPHIYTGCFPVPFFMISNQDNNFILNYLITPCATCPDASTYLTYDRGMNSQSLYLLFGCGGSFFFPSGGDFDPNNDAICYYGYPNSSADYQPSIYKSTNRGLNWFPTATIPDLRNVGTQSWINELSGGFIKVNPFNTEYVFTVHRDYMMLSTDGGYNFSSINIPPLKELSFDHIGNIIYGVTQNTIYKSIDNGVSWTSSDAPFSLNTLEVSPDNNNIIYAGTETGLYRSTDQGATWNLYNNTFTQSKNVIGLSKEINSGDTIFVCTNDAVYKVYRDFLVGINSSNNSSPGSYVLEQNFPNPFNPGTIIRYTLVENLFVTLKVFDVLGNEVTTLVNGKQKSGSYEVEFNAGNLASGIYFYKLESERFVDTKRMILIK